MALRTITNRKDFLALRTAKKAVRGAFVLQQKATGADAPLRVGYVASKKIGNAVSRNRAKRRLRAAALEILAPLEGGKRIESHAGQDVVLIARAAILTISFAALCQDLQSALNQINRPQKQKPTQTGLAGTGAMSDGNGPSQES